MSYKESRIQWYLTSPDGERVQQMPSIVSYEIMSEDIPVITINKLEKKQTIDGFGGTFNEAGWQLLSALDSKARESVLKAFFDPEEGAGYSLCASPIGHNDFSLEYYSYDEKAGDLELHEFSIERDRNFLIPYIQAAKEYGNFKLVCRPDYPPAWMLDDQRQMDAQYFGAFASYLSKYISAYSSEGITVDWMSMFNEPKIYMNIDPESLKRLLRDYVGPLIRREHPEVKLQLCDSYNRDQVLVDYTPALADPVARQYLDGIAYHSYSWDKTSIQSIKTLYEKHPDLKLWQTEVMHLYTKPLYGYYDGEVWGKLIMDDLNAGASGWIFWNMLLDKNGGPWNNNPFNTGYPQDAVAVIVQNQNRVRYTAKYYYQTHFSRFVIPGSLRLGYSVNKSNHPFPENALYWLQIFPFVLPDGKRGMVCMNTNDYEQTGYVHADKIIFKLILPGHSIATYLWED